MTKYIKTMREAREEVLLISEALHEAGHRPYKTLQTGGGTRSALRSRLAGSYCDRGKGFRPTAGSHRALPGC